MKALQDGIAASYRKASSCDHDSNNLQAFQDTAYAILLQPSRHCSIYDISWKRRRQKKGRVAKSEMVNNDLERVSGDTGDTHAVRYTWVAI